MGPSVPIRSRQRLEKEQHQRQKLRQNDPQFQSPFSFPALQGKTVKLSKKFDNLGIRRLDYNKKNRI